jgi:hypothetical protein
MSILMIAPSPGAIHPDSLFPLFEYSVVTLNEGEVQPNFVGTLDQYYDLGVGSNHSLLSNWIK